MINLENQIKHALDIIRNSSDPQEKKGILFNIIKELPKTPEIISLFQLAFDVISNIEQVDERRASIFELIKEIPTTKDFFWIYSKAVELAIDAVDGIQEPISRKTKLLRIAHELPKTDEFTKLRLYAMRLALDLSDTVQHKKASLDEIAKELPKSSDISFYRSYTLLGIASQLPKNNEFIDLHKEAIQRALHAADVIKEPYYREYALLYIARELPKTEEYLALYKQAIEEAFHAAIAIQDPFAKKHALIEILQEIPKTPKFSTLLQQVIKQALDFYAAKRRLENIDIIGRLDYFIAGEQRRLTESKKVKYTKEKYALILARELEQIGLQLNDIRFIETLRPYTHVWIQPVLLRTVAKKIVIHLENLKAVYHGREIGRPIFVKEYHPVAESHYTDSREKIIAQNFVSIDLGATNTVIMRRKGEDIPESVLLDSIAKTYDDTYIIPSILNLETNVIGMEAVGKPHIANFKRMLLDGNPKGKEYMDRYIQVLYQHLKRRMSGGKRFSFFQDPSANILYITVPVGFNNYRKNLKEIIEKTIKGIKIELVEEPLAAAIGYQVAEERDKVIMLIDFGGCTLNTMILRLNIHEVHVVAKPDRAKTLGGHDIDIWLAEHLAKKIGIQRESARYDKLILKAEEIKISLSEQKVVPFEWDENEVCKISREDLEDVLAKYDFYKVIDRSILYLLKRAEKVGVRKDMIEAVLLTGGSSQIPSFKDKIFHLFPNLKEQNAIYDHSPISAVARGGALYATKDVITDRHLAMAYALRYTTNNKEKPYFYKLILESGESLPLEKTFRITPARTLGAQDEIYLELFEVPESMVIRKWVAEAGMEFIQQEIKQSKDMALTGLNIVTLPFKEPIDEDTYITFRVDDRAHLVIRYGKENATIESGLRLQ